MSRRRIAAAITGVLLLAGCQDDPQPRFEDPPDSPSPSESETSEVPEAQSPEEFIREWVRLDNEMQASGKTDNFRDASTGCDACNAYADSVDEIYANGGFIRSEGRTVVDISEKEADRTYEVAIRSAPTKYRESKSAPLQEFAGGETVYLLTLKRRQGAWTVADELEVSQS